MVFPWFSHGFRKSPEASALDQLAQLREQLDFEAGAILGVSIGKIWLPSGEMTTLW